MRPVISWLVALLLISACAAQPPSSAGSIAPPSQALPPSASAPVSPPAATSPLPNPSTAPLVSAPLGSAPAIPLHPTATFPSGNVTLPQAITPLPLEAAPAELVAEVTDRLSQKLNLDPAAIQLFSVTAVAWPDASLGCPVGGQQYAQVVTPGYQIQLEAGGAIYTYHTDVGSQFILCRVEPPHEIYQTP